MKKIFNNRGEIGETMTWVIATIVILFIMILFLLSSTKLGGFSNYDIQYQTARLRATQQSLFSILELDIDGKRVLDELLDSDLDKENLRNFLTPLIMNDFKTENFACDLILRYQTTPITATSVRIEQEIHSNVKQNNFNYDIDFVAGKSPDVYLSCWLMENDE